MKKFILAALVTVIAQSSFADCMQSTKYYESEDDDNGVVLKLALSCESQAGANICVYMNQDYAIIAGANVSSSDMTRQKVSKSGDQLWISLKTSIAQSVFDYRYIRLDLNLKSLKGVVTSGGRGVSPFDGIVTTPEEKTPVQCAKH